MDLNELPLSSLVKRLGKSLLAEFVTGKDQGLRLPKEGELARHYGVSRETIRTVLAALENAGAVKRVIRRGVFVAEGFAKVRREFKGGSILLAFFRAQYHFPLPDLFWGNVLSGLHGPIWGMGLNLNLAAQNVEFIYSDEEMREGYFSDSSILGICLCGPQPPQVMRIVQEVPRPIVAVDFDATGAGLDSFCFNNRRAGEQLAARLWRMGHRRVLVAFESTEKPVARKDPAWEERREGFLSAWRDLGGPAPQEIRLASRGSVFEQASGPVQERMGLLERERPTALVLPTLGSLEPWRDLIGRRGLLVPRDLTIVGFGEQGASSDMSGIRFDGRELGRQAGLHLKRHIFSRRSRTGSPCLFRLGGQFCAGGSHGRPCAGPPHPSR